VKRCLLLLLIAVAALVTVSCGGDEGEGRSANALLKRGFSTDVETGEIKVEMELELEGGEQDQKFSLMLSGPFRSRGPTKLPDADLKYKVSGAGLNFEGRFVMLPENAWLEFGGVYEVGEDLWADIRQSLDQVGEPETFRDANVNPLDWIKGAETSEGEEVSGTETTRVTGELDLAAMLRDYNQLAPSSEVVPQATLDQIDEAIDPVTFEAWIGDDDIWRRISSKTAFTIPEEQQGAGIPEGGRVSLDMTLDAPNEDMTIEGLGEGQPISELLSNLGIPLELPEPG
jgi:hypothetical protein